MGLFRKAVEVVLCLESGIGEHKKYPYYGEWKKAVNLQHFSLYELVYA